MMQLNNHQGDYRDFINDGYKVFHVNHHSEAKKEKDYKGINLTTEERLKRVQNCHNLYKGYLGSGENYHHVPTKDAPIVDIDDPAVDFLNKNYGYFTPSYSHGRNGEGHLVQQVSDPETVPEVLLTGDGVEYFKINGVTIAELRLEGVTAHTVATGKYYKGNDPVFIKKLDGKPMPFKQLWKNVTECVLISAFADIYEGNLFNYRGCVVGEMLKKEIKLTDAHRIFQRTLDVLNHQKKCGTEKGFTDQSEESRKDIEKIYARQKFNKLENLETRIEDKVAKSIRKHLDSYYLSLVEKEKTEEVNADDVDAFVGTDLSDVMNIKYPEMYWLIDKVLPAGLAFLTAKSGAGKTRLLNWICVNVLQGNTLWNEFVLDKGQILALSFEDTDEDWQARTKEMGYTSVPRGLKLITMDSWKGERLGGVLEAKIEKWIKSQPDPRLVIIDTYGTVSKQKKGKDLYLETVQELLPLRKLGRKYNVCILCTHHNKKQKEMHSADNALGSTAILATADTRIVIDLNEEVSDRNITLDISGRRVAKKKWKLSQESDGNWELVSKNAETAREKDTIMEANIRKAFQDLNATKDSPVRVRDITNLLEITTKGAILSPESQQSKLFDNYKKKMGRMYDDNIVEKYDRGLYYPKLEHNFWGGYLKESDAPF